MAEWKTIKDPDGEVHFQCSACGMQWFLAFGTPAQNEMFYCPRCGEKIEYIKGEGDKTWLVTGSP